MDLLSAMGLAKQAMGPQTYKMSSVDRQGFPIDLGRPFVQLRDGGVGTEYQATDVMPDGTWVNYPTIWNGKERSGDDAHRRMLAARKAGQIFPSFGNLADAEAAAADRSRYIGELRNMGGSAILRALLGQ